MENGSAGLGIMTSGFMTNSSRPPMSMSVLTAMSLEGEVWGWGAGVGAAAGTCLGC